MVHNHCCLRRSSCASRSFLGYCSVLHDIGHALPAMLALDLFATTSLRFLRQPCSAIYMGLLQLVLRLSLLLSGFQRRSAL